MSMEQDFTIAAKLPWRSAVEGVVSECARRGAKDIHMPILDGIQATAALRDSVPGCAVGDATCRRHRHPRPRPRGGSGCFVSSTKWKRH